MVYKPTNITGGPHPVVTRYVRLVWLRFQCQCCRPYHAICWSCPHFSLDTCQANEIVSPSHPIYIPTLLVIQLHIHYIYIHTYYVHIYIHIHFTYTLYNILHIHYVYIYIHYIHTIQLINIHMDTYGCIYVTSTTYRWFPRGHDGFTYLC